MTDNEFADLIASPYPAPGETGYVIVTYIAGHPIYVGSICIVNGMQEFRFVNEKSKARPFIKRFAEKVRAATFQPLAMIEPLGETHIPAATWEVVIPAVDESHARLIASSIQWKVVSLREPICRKVAP